jgi:glycosyltransferase involved in cell wall biosynthesis
MQNKKKKIVIVINDFLVGGAQRLIVELLRRLDRNSFNIVLVTLIQFEGRDTMYALIPQDIPVRKLDFKGFKDIKSWVALRKFLKDEDPDVVLSHLFFSNTAVRLLNIFAKYRTVTVEHNTYIGNKRWQIWVDRILSRYSKKIVAVSHRVMEYASLQQGVSRDKFVVIPNGIDVELIKGKVASVDVSQVRKELGVTDGKKIIIVVGRLTGQKEPMLLVGGFARFAQKYLEYHLVILGDGALREGMEERADLLGVGRRIHFLGNVSDIHRYYAVADFLLSTSRIEGLSMAHLEAFACGVPILATHTAGSEELIEDGKNGVYITEWTEKAVENGLIVMYGSDIESMCHVASTTAKCYDIESLVSEYEKLLLTI